ncbi:MAG: type II secretion system protein [bacterium]|nr:type II secretion system protein [bacterium]
MNKGFTLAEVLITLAIIGVVAAISIPSVVSNSRQLEYKTGLKKAVSVLNSAITTSIALDGESPYDNSDLYNYLQRHMSVLKSGKNEWYSQYKRLDGSQTSQGQNYSFYTTDGMRFEFEDDGTNAFPLHESDVKACVAAADKEKADKTQGCTGYCGSMGLSDNPNGTTRPPCAILVDVNGDRLPNPAKKTEESLSSGWSDTNVIYKVAQPGSKLIGDIFTVLITEDRAIPYGVVAQKAMYEAQKY